VVGNTLEVVNFQKVALPKSRFAKKPACQKHSQEPFGRMPRLTFGLVDILFSLLFGG
jgi:hypothetical protein